MAKYAGILLIAAVLAPAQARAEWQFIGSDDNGLRFFMDLSTKRQQGKYTLVWDREDYPKAQVANGKSFNSAKTLTVYDCAEYRYGTKSYLHYSGKSGTGDVVHSASRELSEVDFEDAAPETTGEAMLKIACGKAK
jgi:hypothetical protein